MVPGLTGEKGRVGGGGGSVRGRGGKNVKRKKEREDLIKEGEGERG